MVEKLDEICKKYGLNLIGKPWHEHVDCSNFLSLAGVENLMKEDSGAVLHIPQGRFFPGGSFTVYGTLELPGTEKQLELTYHCVKKDVFYDVFAYADPETVTEHSYTTADGISLLLLESEQSGMILADREDCFLSLSIGRKEGISLEEIAEQFDFTIQTNPLDTSAAEAREQASLEEAYADDPYKDRFSRATYGEYVEDILWSDREKLLYGWDSSDLPQREYAFYDLDGNGVEELLIFCDGYISAVVGMKDGKTNEGKSYCLVLCEDNVLIDRMDLGDSVWYHIFRFANDGDPVFSNPKERSIIRLKVENGVWWRTSSTDHYAEFDTQIAEAEAIEILDSYKPVRLATKPLSEFTE